MTKLIIAIAVIGLSLGAASAQVNSGVAGSPPRDFLTKGIPTGSRERVVGRDDQASKREVSSTDPQSADLKNTTLNHVRSESPNNKAKTNPAPNVAPATSVPVPSSSPSQEYRVGVGDVLDVQLADMPTKKSTLFTVQQGGALDYPLVGESIVVSGLTADEIAIRLRARIKVLENPKVVVKVRDYVSHSVIVTGLVADPGAKFLRREALPLYVLLAEAQPRPEAITATITRGGQSAINVDFTDQKAMSTLVMSGDLIKVVGRPSESAGYFYAGGALSQPGQKVFYSGLTLTQAILASGGVTRDAGSKAKIARQGADGRLTTSEYNLRLIQDGKSVDPVLQRGDRITVGENR